MACIMGCPAAHNNAALRKLPEQQDMEIVGEVSLEKLSTLKTVVLMARKDK